MSVDECDETEPYTWVGNEWKVLSVNERRRVNKRITASE